MKLEFTQLTRYCPDHQIVLGEGECGPCSAMKLGPRDYPTLPEPIIVPCWTFTIKAVDP